MFSKWCKRFTPHVHSFLTVLLFFKIKKYKNVFHKLSAGSKTTKKTMLFIRGEGVSRWFWMSVWVGVGARGWGE